MLAINSIDYLKVLWRNSASFRRWILLLLTGQAFLRARRDKGAQRILWYYNWDAIGDSIMDLSQRFIIDDGVRLDLCIGSCARSLYKDDKRFHRVVSSLADCGDAYDIIIVQNLTSKFIKQKLLYFPFSRWMNIQSGGADERFARIDLAHEKISGLFGVRQSSPVAPSLNIEADDAGDSAQFCVVVAVGGEDPRRRYERWDIVINAMLRTPGIAAAQPVFHLIGSGESATKAAALVNQNVRYPFVACNVNLPGVADAARLISKCAFFIGADGGLMHIAAALDKPGVALFSKIRPELRLHKSARLRSLFTEGEINDVDADAIAATASSYCREVAANLATAPRITGLEAQAANAPHRSGLHRMPWRASN